MRETYNDVISVINKELDAEHKRAMGKVRSVIIRKEEVKLHEKHTLMLLNERYKRLESILPKLNGEIEKHQELNRRSMNFKKTNERKQVALKKIIEAKQKQLNSLMDQHAFLLEEMNERNRKETDLIKRTERILFFKKQLLRLMRKTRAEIDRTEQQIGLLSKEEQQLDKTKMPEMDEAVLQTMKAPDEKSAQKRIIIVEGTSQSKDGGKGAVLRITKRKDRVRIVKEKSHKPKIDIKKSDIRFHPKKGLKVDIKVK